MKSKSAEHESKKSKDKKTQKKASKDKGKHGEDGDKEMSSNNVEPMSVQPQQSDSTAKPEESPSDESTEESVQNLRKHRRSSQPIPVSGSLSGLRPSLSPSMLLSDNSFVNRQQHGNSATLLRLLNANHDEDMPAKFARGDERSSIALKNSTGIPSPHMSPPLTNGTVSLNPLRSLPQITTPNRHLPEYNISSRLQHSLSLGQANASRPFDLAPSHHQRQQTQPALQRQPNYGIIQHPNGSVPLDRSNATILDIVDNLTGRQINKSKIGTYELEGHNMVANETTTITHDIGAGNSSSNRANNTMSKYTSGHNQPGVFTNASSLGGRQHYRAPASNHQPTQAPTVNRASVAMRPQIVKNGPQALNNDNNNNVDGSLLYSLLQKATNTMQQVKQETQPAVQPYGESAAIQRPFSRDQVNIYPPLPNQNSEPLQMQRINKLSPVRQQQSAAPQSHITAAQAEVAARLLQLVQPASNRAMPVPSNLLGGQQQLNGGNLYDSPEHHRLANALNQRLRQSNYLQQEPLATSDYHQQVPVSRPSSLQMFTSPPPRQQPQHSQINFNGASGNPSGQFGAEQLLDYELYPISRATHNFFAD